MFYSFTNYSIYSNMDVNAKLFIDNVGLTTFNHKIAINNLVLDLKTNNLWNKFIAIYPIIGGTATTHKYNLKDPEDEDASYRIVFSGGITHNSSGILGNGTNGYGDTKIVPSTHFLQNDVSGFAYSKTNVGGAHVDFGVLNASAPLKRFQITSRNGSDLFNTGCNTDTLDGNSNNNSIGFFGISRINSTDYKQTKNLTQTNVTKTSTGLSTGNLTIMAQYQAGTIVNYSPRQYAFFAFGKGLTDTECDNLYILVQRYQTLLNRNI